MVVGKLGTKKKAPAPPQRLFRSETDRVIAGVCGGLGEYTSIDTTIVRLIFVLLTIFGGSGILLYLILWIIMPSKQSVLLPSQYIKENVNEMKEKAKEFSSTVDGSRESKNRSFLALFLILLGTVFLFNNFGFYRIDFSKLWPLLLIIGGLLLLRKW